MELQEILAAAIRKENFGGIIYLPSRNIQLAVNADLLNFVACVKQVKSDSETVKLIAKTYAISELRAKKLLQDCLMTIAEEVEHYSENDDICSDWNLPNQPRTKDRIKLSAPLMLIIEVTNRCNQKCRFCYEAWERNDLNVSELPQAQFRGIVDQAEEIGVFKIQYMGGEPLCRKDFPEILAYTSRQGLFVSFTTNGFLLNEVIDELKSIERLLPVQVSIHGSSADSLTEYAISPKEWRKSINNCRLLGKYGIPFGIKTVISRFNYRRLFEAAALFSDLGAKTVTFLHLLPVGGAAEMKESIWFQPEEITEIIEQIKSAQEKFPLLHFDYRAFLNLYFPRQPKTKLDEFLNCPAGGLDLRIRCDGKVLQCSSLRIPIDDLTVKSLKDVWDSIEEKMKPCPYEDDIETHSCIKHY